MLYEKIVYLSWFLGNMIFLLGSSIIVYLKLCDGKKKYSLTRVRFWGTIKKINKSELWNHFPYRVFIIYIYHKIGSSNTSHLQVQAGFFRLFTRGIFLSLCTVTFWQKKNFLMSVPLNVVVNTILIQYCSYYEI